MASDIGPGDFVECVDARPCAFSGKSLLVAGAIYQVYDLDVGVSPDGELGLALSLVEISDCDLAGRFVFCATRFRPIYRPKSEIIESLKAPAPELEPA